MKVSINKQIKVLRNNINSKKNISEQIKVLRDIVNLKRDTNAN